MGAVLPVRKLLTSLSPKWLEQGCLLQPSMGKVICVSVLWRLIEDSTWRAPCSYGASQFIPTAHQRHWAFIASQVPSSQDFEGLMLLSHPSLTPLHLTLLVGVCGSPTRFQSCFFRCSVCTAGSQKASTSHTFSSNSKRAQQSGMTFSLEYWQCWTEKRNSGKSLKDIFFYAIAEYMHHAGCWGVCFSASPDRLKESDSLTFCVLEWDRQRQEEKGIYGRRIKRGYVWVCVCSCAEETSSSH